LPNDQSVDISKTAGFLTCLTINLSTYQRQQALRRHNDQFDGIQTTYILRMSHQSHKFKTNLKRLEM